MSDLLKRIQTKSPQSSLFHLLPTLRILPNFSCSIKPSPGTQYEHRFGTHGWLEVLRSATAAMGG